ncbi:hypothetical protein [Streptomyces huiliensis]|uniref:hypothetical protein n=1 Tax=Streptomyces huiliensis TaxID=2876027 RepID=UPI001CBC27D8|nr:hypothetical protein [Streptomyces huiliensis]MBZ4320755.1 hypothetical protein [Streptomyces huiliensis]
MIDVLLHRFHLVEFARDAADQRLLAEARTAGRSEGDREAGRQVGTGRQRRAGRRTGL